MAKKKTTETKSSGSRTQASGLKSLFAESDVCWDTPRLRTGITPLDYILGGGFGYGRLGELYGGHSSTKTYILYRALIACQQEGGTAVLAESEGAYDPLWFERLGGNPRDLLVAPIDTVQAVFSLFQKVTEFAEGRDSKICIGWDGIAATATAHLMDKGLDKVDMSKAKVMSQGCEWVTTAIKRKQICVIATNQIRASMDPYKPPVTPGGFAWPFHASQRIEMKFDGGRTNNMIIDETNKVTKLMTIQRS
jgi:RecA/RadA recombinase